MGISYIYIYIFILQYIICIDILDITLIKTSKYLKYEKTSNRCFQSLKPHLKPQHGHLPTHRSLKFFPVEALRGLLAASVSHLQAIDFTGVIFSGGVGGVWSHRMFENSVVYHHWLVVWTCFNHLEKYESIWKWMGRIILYFMEKKTCSKPPTSHHLLNLNGTPSG